jgi:2-oxoacid:acceptor oxidoreductase delta subunit (pyruvate/2-ketoisovalerate family)
VNPQELFAEPTLKQITIWARGVTHIKDGRDVAFVIAEAGRRDGKHVQGFENYVDLPDRINVPVCSYARVADEPIQSRFLYENDTHDVVVVVEESLVRTPKLLNNIVNGAILVVNTKRPAAEIARFIQKHPHLKSIVTVDAQARGQAVFTFSGQEGATDATGIGKGLAAVLAGAVAKATGFFTLDSLKAVARDPDAAQFGFDTCTIAPAQELFERVGQPFTGDTKTPVYLEVPFAGTVPEPGERNRLMVTGTWRVERPVLSPELCTQCNVCVIDCPDACIKLSGSAIEIDYEFCKGCGLCTAVCPTNALKDEPELNFVS